MTPAGSDRGRLIELGRGATSAAGRVSLELTALAEIIRAGMMRPQSPLRLARAGLALRRFGPLGGSVGAAAARHPGAVGLVDELGSLTFSELESRSNAVANSWRAVGAEPGLTIGLLCRNHRGFLDAAFAAGKLGARLVLLNTDFAGPQLRDVCEREGVELLVCDQEYDTITEGLEPRLGVFTAWADEPTAQVTLEELVAAGDPSPPPAPDVDAKAILLTSGTTGTPKGAPRETPVSLVPLGAVLGKIPFRTEESTHVAAPLFHALGFAHAFAAPALGSTLVLRRRFMAESALRATSQNRCTTLIVVPVMLARILALPADIRAANPLDALRIVFVGGSQLDAELATRALDELGDVVYNLYGTTEVAYATIATPAELRASPGSAGSPPLGVTVKILDEAGGEVAPGETGRIFVGSGLEFEGYTGGGGKEVIDGLMSTGDVGHFDANGCLHVDGRDDEMIVSGGENVFPREIEELLVTHEAIDEAAAIGVDDEEYGQRLSAFVVCRSGASLSEDDVREFVKRSLARYKVPRDVRFIEGLPRNPSGKVLKRVLAEMAEAR